METTKNVFVYKTITGEQWIPRYAIVGVRTGHGHDGSKGEPRDVPYCVIELQGLGTEPLPSDEAIIELFTNWFFEHEGYRPSAEPEPERAEPERCAYENMNGQRCRRYRRHDLDHLFYDD